LAVVAAFSLALQPAFAQTLRTGGAGQPPIGVRITGVIDANGNVNPAVVPASIALAGDGTALAASGSTGSNVNIASVGGNAVTTTVPVSDGGGSLTVDSLQLPASLGIKTAAASISVAPASDALYTVVGSVASGSADSGNPVKIGGVYNVTVPTLADGQRGNLMLGQRGSAHVTLFSQNGTASPTMSSALDALAANTGLFTTSFGELFNGSTWDRQRSIGGAVAAGTGTAAFALAPSSASAAAIAPAVSTAVEGSRVFKASAGNLYRIALTTGASAGFLMVFDATSAPADGAVTPTLCRAIAANTSLEVDHAVAPDRYATGITAVFSTTGCFTKTVSATAMFEGSVL